MKESLSSTLATGNHHSQPTDRALRTTGPCRAGFTLVEIMISILIASMLATAGFSSMGFVRRSMLDNIHTAEAYRIAQAKIEELQAGPIEDFVPSPEETIESTVTTTFRRNQAARFAPTGSAPDARLNFVREVELVPSASGPVSYIQLRVNVTWSQFGRERGIDLTTCRAN